MQSVLGALAFAGLIGAQFMAAIILTKKPANIEPGGPKPRNNADQARPPESRLLSSARALTFCALLVALPSHKGIAADLTDALIAHARHDDARAVEQLTILAEHGNAVAEETLGTIYLNGDGAGRDSFRAFQWLKAAAEQGRPEAEFKLGEMLRDGIGVAADGKLALVWLLRAAAQNVPHAYGEIGELYETDADIPRDTAAALRWFIRGAALDDAASMYHLGIHYALGNGVATDAIEAHKWFGLAAGVALDHERDIAVQARMLMTWQLTPAEVNESSVRAEQWQAAVRAEAPLEHVIGGRDAILARAASSSWTGCGPEGHAPIPITAARIRHPKKSPGC
ncbi:MAG: tetratricopeptide repeat protein [Pseudomonadota bacterium]